MALRTFYCRNHNVTVLIDEENKRETRVLPGNALARVSPEPANIRVGAHWQSCCLLHSNAPKRGLNTPVQEKQAVPATGKVGLCEVEER